MKVSPLSFNIIDYGHVVVALGKIPNIALVHMETLSDLWRSQIEKTSSEIIREKYFTKTLTPANDNVFHNLNSDIDRFIDQQIMSQKEWQAGKECVLLIQDVHLWSDNGVLPSLISEARPKQLVVVVEGSNICRLTQSMTDNLFGSSSCVLTGTLNEKEKTWLSENTYYGDPRYHKLQRVFSLDNDKWSMYFPYPRVEAARKGLFIYEDLREIEHIEI